MIEERPRLRAGWLIVRDKRSGTREVLIQGIGGEETLPVFSFEEEALLYLELCGLRRGWRAIESGIPDLVSILGDPWLGVRRIALDPSSEIGLHGLHYLVSLPREEFVEMLVARERSGNDPYVRLETTKRTVHS